MHSFFGSDAVTVNTTTSEELRAGCHTNDNPNDYSVYCMVQTLASLGTYERIPIEPRYFKAYYIGIESAEIPYPEDFKTVAGSASAKSQADVDELTGVQWFCEYGPAKAEGADVAAFPTTGCDIGRLQSLLLFHDCVNPNTLESAYSGRHNLPRVNRCPEGMSRIPQLRFSVRFDTSEALPDGWSGEAPLQLASGPSYSWHGDFINGWVPEAAKNMLQAGGKRDFQAVKGPLDKQPACTPKDSEPDNGTSDYEESLLSFQNQALPVAAASSSAFSTAAAAATTSVVSSASDAAATSSPAATGCKRAKRARRTTWDA
ncbi:hypothetical protein C8A01DRAFT_48815 [Parachaetomium inaequale]|uniref:DUF1996 domain-containing protein n=1 Tax=Parachaetomium inaequale TaxID=2588326 RepID=A0AAN6PAV7_9PEZI|nr:hypothetical protein C8A01DRAFT_48815 [Parachaetomium inaequale]